MKKYQIIKTQINLENSQITSYGIKSDEAVIMDISTNKSYVKSIVKALNKNNVSETHLNDIVEDYLASN